MERDDYFFKRKHNLVKVFELVLVDPCVVLLEEPQRLSQLGVLFEVEIIEEEQQVLPPNRLHLVLGLLLHVLQQRSKDVIRGCVLANLQHSKLKKKGPGMVFVCFSFEPELRGHDFSSCQPSSRSV